MNKETIEFLDKLAEQLGTTSEYLFQVLIDQAWYSFVGDTLAFVCAVGILVISMRYFVVIIKDDSMFPMVFAVSMVMAICVIFILAFVANFSGNLAKVFNPEYFALSEILKYIP